MMVMDAEKLEELENLLLSEDTESLHVLFVDDESYELSLFSVAQDADEEFPHCTAIVIRPINIPEHKRKFFNPDSGMMFSLNDVTEVRDAKTNERIFCSQIAA